MMAVECPALHRTWGVAAVMVTVMMVGYVSSLEVVEVSRVNEVGERKEGEEAVSLLWGIADTTASVGRLFRYHIPGDAFQGHVDTYEVVEAGKTSLPSWLHFVAGQNVLQGIPTPADAGQLYLQVTARSHHGSTATDVFSLAVKPDTAAMSLGQPLKFKKSGPKAVRCKREEPETVATIVLDADLDLLPVERRLDILTAFLTHMGLGDEMVKMVPASGHLLHDDTALVTGTGDVSEPQHVGVSVSWLVGCGKVESGHFPVLQKLDDDSGSGVMGKALGVPVVGWRVTNTRFQQQALKRRRRQVRATATPVITITPPTATDTDEDTMTRQVVDMSSPTFTIEPTPAQPMMPKTTTPAKPATPPKAETPDEVQPSKPQVQPPEVSKTDALPSPTEKPMMPTKKPAVVVPAADCLRPRVNKGFAKKTFPVGEVINFRIPENLFSTCDGGGTRQTKLTLFGNESTPIPKKWFLQFDQRRQTIRGMPMNKDVGMYNMTLVSMLMTHDYITRFSFKIEVFKPRGRKARVNHELSMSIDTDYDEFMASMDKKLDLAKKVAELFGDEDTSALTVTRIDEGSVIYAFTNNTLSGRGCPVGDVTGMADKLVSADGKIIPEALEKLNPWILTRAAVAPAGACEGNPSFPVRSASVAKPKPDSTTRVDKPMMPDSVEPTDKPDVPDMPDKTAKPKASAATPNVTGVASAGKSTDGNIWITTVVPAVVIVAILLIALLIACILYRKKRKGKMNLEEQNTFVNKGAPVIFPDELDDRPSDSTKPLLIEGSPPAPPPEYHRGTSEGSDPGSSHKETTPPTDEVDAEIEIDATSPLYQPPPPVPAFSGKQARPHVQQPYRSQPPEIHP